MRSRKVVLALGAALLAGSLEASELPAPEAVKTEAVTDEAESLSGRVADFRKEHERSQILIALLADPLDSNLSHEFDLYLTELVRGLELQGYLLQGFSFPWHDYEIAKATGNSPTPSYRDSPGVLFFRGEELLPGKQRVETGLIVLAVGETPSEGVQRQALREALSIACDQKRADKATEPEYINVLGPTFSGTADSLMHEIETFQPCRAWSFRVRSGSATSDAVYKSLNSSCRVDFETQATLDSLKRDQMLKFLRDNLGFDRIALLVESSTFGGSYDDDSQVTLTLPFPMHISHLRSAYSRIEANAKQESASPANLGPGLNLDLAEVDGAREELPVFSVDLTSATYDLVLGQILRTLSERRIQAAGIVATNVKDKIFLANEINRHAPNIRLFTFEADALLAHPAYGSATRGMLIASSHALELAWPGSPATARRFGNDGSQGLFEATVLLMDEIRGEKRFPAASPDGCHLSSGENRKQVWISVVGRGGLYPIAALPTSGAIPSGPSDSGVPRGWMLVFLAMSFLVAHLTWWLRNLRATQTRPAAADSNQAESSLLILKRRFCPILDRNESERRRYEALVLTLLGLAGAAYLVVAGPVVGRLFGYRSDVGRWWIPALAAALTLWLLWAAVPASLAILKRSGLTVGVACALAWLGIYGLVVYLVFRPLERSLDLDSGVSPMLPILLLLAVPGLWAVTGVIRCLAFEQPLFHYPDGPMVESLKESFESFRPSPKLLGKSLPFMLATTVVPAFYLAIYYGSPGPLVRGIEDYGVFDSSISLLLLAGVLLVTEACCRCRGAFSALRLAVEKGLAAEPDLATSLKKGDALSGEKSDSLVIARQITESLIKQVRNLMFFSTVGLILILLALLTYPFEPDRVLALYLSILIIPCALLAISVNIRIAKSPSLALFRQTQDTWWRPDRILRVAFYAGVPALGIISSRFPGTLDFFINLLEPVFKVFS